jgi:hypothetical protein
VMRNADDNSSGFACHARNRRPRRGNVQESSNCPDFSN